MIPPHRHESQPIPADRYEQIFRDIRPEWKVVVKLDSELPAVLTPDPDIAPVAEAETPFVEKVQPSQELQPDSVDENETDPEKIEDFRLLRKMAKERGMEVSTRNRKEDFRAFLAAQPVTA